MKIARFRKWPMLVGGVLKQVYVVSTDVPDQIGQINAVYNSEYDNTLAYAAGAIVRVSKIITVGGVTLVPGVYGSVEDVPANGTSNQVPQWPQPASGTIYWYLFCFTPKLMNVCASGQKTLYINASDQL